MLLWRWYTVCRIHHDSCSLKMILWRLQSLQSFLFYNIRTSKVLYQLNNNLFFQWALMHLCALYVTCLWKLQLFSIIHELYGLQEFSWWCKMYHMFIKAEVHFSAAHWMRNRSGSSGWDRMMATSGCWWLYVCKNFRMLVTEFRHWWHLLDVGVLR